MLRWIGKWDVPSDSDPNKTYVVSISEAGIWGCSCWAWKRQGGHPRDRKNCKHIRRVRRQVGDLE